MVFASLFLMLGYLAFMSVLYVIAVVMPVVSVILAALNLAALILLLILWFRLKKKGLFSREYLEKMDAQEHGYWKVIGLRVARAALIVVIVLTAVSLVVSAALAAIFLAI